MSADHFHAWTQATDAQSGEWEEPQKVPIARDLEDEALLIGERLIRAGIDQGGSPVELSEVPTPAELPASAKVYAGTNDYGVRIRIWTMPCRENRALCSVVD